MLATFFPPESIRSHANEKLVFFELAATTIQKLLILDQLTYMGVFLIWYKREQLAQTAFSTIASLYPPITITKREGFYVELFLISAFPFELE